MKTLAANPCNDILPLLPAYARGEWSHFNPASVAAHLEECGACRRALAEIQRVQSLLDLDAAAVAPSPGFQDRLLAGLQAAGIPVQQAGVPVQPAGVPAQPAGEKAEGAGGRAPRAKPPRLPIPPATWINLGTAAAAVIGLMYLTAPAADPGLTERLASLLELVFRQGPDQVVSQGMDTLAAWFQAYRGW